MTIGINTSPLSGTEGTKVTARLLKNRLDAELVGNVSIRLLATERPDTWEVQGHGGASAPRCSSRCCDHEGFELTVGKPQVVTRIIDGMVHEPVEAVSIDVPEDFLGVVTQLLSLRKGRLVQMVNHGTGWARVDFWVPDSPRTDRLSYRVPHQDPRHGRAAPHLRPLRALARRAQEHGASGSLVADRRGLTTNYALLNLQDRGALFVSPGVEVYEGMIVGENARSEDMDINPTKGLKVTNVRSSTSEELVRLIPPRLLSLEQALEKFISARTSAWRRLPRSVRLRKVVLDQAERGRHAAQSKRALQRDQVAEAPAHRRAG